MISRPSVTKRFDDYIATWPGDPRAKVCFSITGDRVVVTDITRSNLPKGSAGYMIALSLTVHGELTKPRFIQAMNVLNKNDQHGQNSMMLLGDVLKRAAIALHGRPVSVKKGNHLGKDWIEVEVSY